MHLTRPLRLFLLTTLLGLLACQPAAPVTPAASASEPAPAPASDEPLLRTYAVPATQERAIERALSSALSTGKDSPPLGTVRRLPDGRLLVVGPAGIQDGIAALIRDLDPEQTPPVRTAELDYWIVLAEPAETASGVDGVPAIAPALQAIVQSQGAMKFTVLETMNLSSLLEESAEADGERLTARQVVTEVGGRLIADLGLSVMLGPGTGARPREIFCQGGSCKKLRSRIHLEPDQLLVIGQTGISDAEGSAGAAPRTMFYLVRGRLRTGAA